MITCERCKSTLRGGGDVQLWTQWMSSLGVLKRGAKKRIAEMEEHAVASVADLDKLFEPAALESLLDTFEGNYNGLLQWWQERVASAHRERLNFPLKIAIARGPQALQSEPQVVVGTIHSVKGGEADVVFLVPDLSNAGYAAYANAGPTRDSVIRLCYVGLTRARDTVYICSPESGRTIRI